MSILVCFVSAALLSARNAALSIQHLRSRDDAGGDGPELQVELQNFFGVQYSGMMTIGGQTLMVVYDTGSFEVMAVTEHCAGCKSSQSMYDNSTSATFEAGNSLKGERHHFGSGMVFAKQDFETVRIGSSTSTLMADHMAFWQILDTDISTWTQDKANHAGVAGLGFRAHVPGKTDSRSGQDAESLLERLGVRRFSICLERGPSNPGWLTFNPAVNLASTAGYRTVPVIASHHWGVALHSVWLGDGVEDPCGPDGCVAIVDSGTSLISVPPKMLYPMMSVITKVNHNCSNLGDLPDLIFDLGGQKFNLPPSAWVLQLAHGSGASSTTTCMPAFNGINMTTDMGAVWILGMPFLRHFKTVFDRDGPSLHIADQGENGCDDRTPPPAGNKSSPPSSFLNPHPPHASRAARYSGPTMVDPRLARGPSWQNDGHSIVF